MQWDTRVHILEVFLQKDINIINDYRISQYNIEIGLDHVPGLQDGIESADEKRREPPRAAALSPLQHEVRVRPLHRPQGAADEHLSGPDPHFAVLLCSDCHSRASQSSPMQSVT